MTKTIQPIILILLFSSPVFADKNKQIKITNQKHTAQKSKSLSKKRTSASVHYDKAKEEFLGADYYKPIDSQLIRQPVMEQLKKIENLCQSQASFQEKINILKSSLQKIREIADQYFEEPNLESEDRLWIGGIRSNTSRRNISYNQPITQELLMEIDIKREFALSYYNHYRLPDDTSVENFPHQWAKMIYKGLDCIQN